MNYTLESAADLIGQTSWLAIVIGVALFVTLGKARLSTPLAYGLAVVLSFIYAIVLTRGADTHLGSDEQLLMTRVITALAYATFLAVIYCLAQANFRSASAASRKKPVIKAVPKLKAR